MALYTNRFIPEGFAGCTRGPFIFIRPEYRDDRGLLEHEKTHVRQWAVLSAIACSVLAIGGFLLLKSTNYQALAAAALAISPLGLALHSLLYKLLPGYRLDCELEAYKEQLRHTPQHINLYANFIATKYDLKISQGEAITLLKNHG